MKSQFSKSRFSFRFFFVSVLALLCPLSYAVWAGPLVSPLPQSPSTSPFDSASLAASPIATLTVPDGLPDLPLDNLAVMALVFGNIIPGLVAAIARAEWKPQVKTLASIAICVVCAGLSLHAQGRLNSANWMVTGLSLLAATEYFYKRFWKGSSVEQHLATQVNVFPPASNSSTETDQS